MSAETQIAEVGDHVISISRTSDIPYGSRCVVRATHRTRPIVTVGCSGIQGGRVLNEKNYYVVD
jgi:hypothetical protein